MADMKMRRSAFTAVSNDAAYNGETSRAMVDVADGPGLVVSPSEMQVD